MLTAMRAIKVAEPVLRVELVFLRFLMPTASGALQHSAGVHRCQHDGVLGVVLSIHFPLPLDWHVVSNPLDFELDAIFN